MILIGFGRLNAPAPPRGGIHLKHSSSFTYILGKLTAALSLAD